MSPMANVDPRPLSPKAQEPRSLSPGAPDPGPFRGKGRPSEASDRKARASPWGEKTNRNQPSKQANKEPTSQPTNKRTSKQANKQPAKQPASQPANHQPANRPDHQTSKAAQTQLNKQTSSTSESCGDIAVELRPTFCKMARPSLKKPTNEARPVSGLGNFRACCLP